MYELFLKVEKKWFETPTIPVVRLNLDGKNYPYKAGQYSLVSVKANGEFEERAFSMACTPNESYVEFATRMSESNYKKAFASLEAGDEVKLTGPLGQFTLVENAESICFLSGGIGITPIRSMVQFICREKLPLQVTLLFGNRNPAEIPFKKEFDELAEKNKNLKVIHIVSEGNANWKGLTGRIDEAIIKKYSQINRDLYYTCGPPAMVDSLFSTLKTLGVPEQRIKIEQFAGYK